MSWAHVSDKQLPVFRSTVRWDTETASESTPSGEWCTPERSFAKGRADLTRNRRRAESSLGLTVLSVRSVKESEEINEPQTLTYLANEAWPAENRLLRKIMNRTFGALAICVFDDSAMRLARIVVRRGRLATHPQPLDWPAGVTKISAKTTSPAIIQEQ